MFEDDDARVYQAVRNAAGQYSVWPIDRPVPAGWEPTGHTGTKAACLDVISTLWTQLTVGQDPAAVGR